jgi:hypothetical protein
VNLYDDAILTIGIKTANAAPGTNPVCYVFIYGSEDGIVYSGSTGEGQGTDAGMTLDSPSNMKGPYVISCPTQAKTYYCVIGSIASLFGGNMPRRWGFAILNTTGQALDSTEGNHQKTYTGITYTNA